MEERPQLRAELRSLRRREAQLEEELQAELRAELPARQPPAAAAAKAPTDHMRDVALRVFALADFQVEAPLKYLSMRSRPASESDIRNWHADLLPDRRACLLISAPGDRLAERRLAEARKFVAELRLVSWVRDQNYSNGLAPTSTLIVGHAGPGVFRCKGEKNKFREVRRCMQRWGGRRAVLGNGDGLSQDEFRRKACRAFPAQTFGESWHEN